LGAVRLLFCQLHDTIGEMACGGGGGRTLAATACSLRVARWHATSRDRVFGTINGNGVNAKGEPKFYVKFCIAEEQGRYAGVGLYARWHQ